MLHYQTIINITGYAVPLLSFEVVCVSSLVNILKLTNLMHSKDITILIVLLLYTTLAHLSTPYQSTMVPTLVENSKNLYTVGTKNLVYNAAAIFCSIG